MDTTIARWRLATQLLSAPHASTVDDVLDRLLAVQAENPAQSAWAVAARTGEPDASALAERLASGGVVRTHVLRPTWHYVAVRDVDWLLALTGPRTRPISDRQLTRDLGLDLRDVDALGATVLELLAAEPDRTRDEVVAALEDRHRRLLDGRAGRVAMHVLMRLEVDRLVVSGRPRGGVHTYAPYEDRVPRTPAPFDRDAALAGLARRYFTGHGPATDQDLAYWATLPITDVRRGRAAVQGELESFEHDGRTFWHAPGEPPEGAGTPGAHLLQVLDEMHNGYQDSRMVLDARGVVPRRRGAAVGMALVDGQMVAGMRRTVGASSVTFALTPFAPLSRGERRALDEAADRCGAFLGRPATVEVSVQKR